MCNNECVALNKEFIWNGNMLLLVRICEHRWLARNNSHTWSIRWHASAAVPVLVVSNLVISSPEYGLLLIHCHTPGHQALGRRLSSSNHVPSSISRLLFGLNQACLKLNDWANIFTIILFDEAIELALFLSWHVESLSSFIDNNVLVDGSIGIHIVYCLFLNLHRIVFSIFDSICFVVWIIIQHILIIKHVFYIVWDHQYVEAMFCKALSLKDLGRLFLKVFWVKIRVIDVATFIWEVILMATYILNWLLRSSLLSRVIQIIWI